MTTIGVFAGVFDEQGRVLCVRHNYGNREWGMPGGQLEPGEDPLTCLEREVLEETGYLIVVRNLVGIYSAVYRDDLVILFAADAGKREAWSPNDEIGEVAFFGLDDLPEPMAANPKLRFCDLAADVTAVVRRLSAPGVIA